MWGILWEQSARKGTKPHDSTRESISFVTVCCKSVNVQQEQLPKILRKIFKSDASAVPPPGPFDAGRLTQELKLWPPVHALDYGSAKAAWQVGSNPGAADCRGETANRQNPLRPIGRTAHQNETAHLLAAG